MIVKTLKMMNTPNDENVKKVQAMVMNDHQITIKEVADDVGILIGACHENFSNVLGMKRVVLHSKIAEF